MRRISYAQALVEALEEAVSTSREVTIIGSHFLGISPQKHLLHQVRQKHSDRFIDPPISELAYVGMGVGAAMMGLRPIVDVATATFAYVAMSQFANEAANVHYTTGGQTSVPAVFHLLCGIRGGGAPQHSSSPQSMFWNVPGLEIMLPATPYDLKGLMRTAVASNNPTIFIDNTRLFDIEGDVPDEHYTIPLGEAVIRREGADLTIVATSFMVHYAMDAAAELAVKGISAEVLDPRTLVPLDKAAILRSVAKTGRVVIVDEGQLSCGVTDGLAAIIAEDGFEHLKAPIRRIAIPDVPIPYSEPLENELGPTVAKIVAAAGSFFARRAA